MNLPDALDKVVENALKHGVENELAESIDLGTAFAALQEVALERGFKIAITILPADIPATEVKVAGCVDRYVEMPANNIVTSGQMDRLASFLVEQYQVVA